MKDRPLTDEEYDALVLRVAEKLLKYRVEWTLDNCLGIVRTGVRPGISSRSAEGFEKTFEHVFTALEREAANV